MTANEVLNITLKMLGYSDADGNPKLTQRIRNGAVTFVNLVYMDLWHILKEGEFKPIKSLSEELQLPEGVLYDTFTYGLAMHIAQSESDGDQQQFYVLMYNRKRLRLSKTEEIIDVIPRGGY